MENIENNCPQSVPNEFVGMSTYRGKNMLYSVTSLFVDYKDVLTEQLRNLIAGESLIITRYKYTDSYNRLCRMYKYTKVKKNRPKDYIQQVIDDVEKLTL